VKQGDERILFMRTVDHTPSPSPDPPPDHPSSGTAHSPLPHHHPRVRTDLPVQLAVPHVYRVHPPRPVLQQAIRKPTRRRPRCPAHSPYIDPELPQAPPPASAPPAPHTAARSAPRSRILPPLASPACPPLLPHHHLPGHDRRCAFSRLSNDPRSTSKTSRRFSMHSTCPK